MKLKIEKNAKRNIKKTKNFILKVDEQFGNKLLYKRRVNMIMDNFLIEPEVDRENEQDFDQIVLARKTEINKYRHVSRLMVFNDEESLRRFVITIDNNDLLDFEPLSDEYRFEYRNHQDGISITVLQSNFFNPAKTKIRILKSEMQAFVGNVDAVENKFRLSEVHYSHLEMLVNSRDISCVDVTKPLSIIAYNRGFLQREF